jgi:hypothetical protein
VTTVDTKLKGDIAEQATIVQALKRGWGVLKPIGDRLPYDLVFDLDGTLLKIQVKATWLHQSSGNYVVDNRRTKTNRRHMVRSPYQLTDFDFAIAYIDELEVFYVFPAEVFISYGSEIHLVEAPKRQRQPRSSAYRQRWDLLQALPLNLNQPIPEENSLEILQS